jgi:hypothetical protein
MDGSIANGLSTNILSDTTGTKAARAATIPKQTNEIPQPRMFPSLDLAKG